jgi:hypothetical protein
VEVAVAGGSSPNAAAASLVFFLEYSYSTLMMIRCHCWLAGN